MKWEGFVRRHFRWERAGGCGRHFFRELAVLSLLLCLPGLCLTAHADGRITYEGAAEGYLFAADGQQPVTHLFGCYPAIMSGEVLTDELLVQNLPEGEYALYLRCGGTEKTGELLSRSRLEIRDPWERLIFDGTLDKLSAWQFLGNFEQEDQALLTLTLTVPQPLSSQSQSDWTKLQWEILAEKKLPDGAFSDLPKTGDRTALLPAAGAAAVSALGLLVTAGKAGRKHGAGKEKAPF